MDRVITFLKYTRADPEPEFPFLVETSPEKLNILFACDFENDGVVKINRDFTQFVFGDGKKVINFETNKGAQKFGTFVDHRVNLHYCEKNLYNLVDEFYIKAYITLFYKYIYAAGYYYKNKFYKARRHDGYTDDTDDDKPEITPDGYAFKDANEDCLDDDEEKPPYQRFCADLVGDLIVNKEIDESMLKNYIVTWFKRIHISNDAGFNEDSRGSNNVRHKLKFSDTIDLPCNHTLYDLGNCLYTMKSHKFDRWYELWMPDIDVEHHKEFNDVTIDFDHGS
jgi:hypothetical protein